MSLALGIFKVKPWFGCHIGTHFVPLCTKEVTLTHSFLVQCTLNYLTHQLLKYRLSGWFIFYIIKFGRYLLCTILPSFLPTRFPADRSSAIFDHSFSLFSCCHFCAVTRPENLLFFSSDCSAPGWTIFAANANTKCCQTEFDLNVQ